MRAHPLLFLLEFLRHDLGERMNCLAPSARPRNQFPGTTALNPALGRSALPGRGQQASLQIPKLAFARIIRPRQVGDVIGVEQTWGVTRRDCADRFGIGLQTRLRSTLGLNRRQHLLPFGLHFLPVRGGLAAGSALSGSVTMGEGNIPVIVKTPVFVGVLGLINSLISASTVFRNVIFSSSSAAVIGRAAFER